MTRLALLLVLLGGARLILPGDVPFVNDEPMLLERALDANEAGTLAASGLLGTRSARYGPAPVWFYQAALSFTRDLPPLARMRAAVVTLLTGAALLLLAGALGGEARSVDAGGVARSSRPADAPPATPVLVPVLGAFAFLSPYLWFYARDLGDNSFSIPLSALLLAAYVAFLESGRVRWLALAGLCGALCLLTHLMTLPLVAATAIHFVVTRGRSLRDPRVAIAVTGIGIACVAICLPYLRSMGGGSMAGFRLVPSPGSVLYAVSGLRVLTLAGFDYFVGEWGTWLPAGTRPLALGAVGLSLFSWAAGAVGAVVWGRDAFGGRVGGVAGSVDARVPADAMKPTEACEDPLRKSVGLLLFLALGLFVLLASGLRLREHPHYYNGVWVIFFMFGSAA